MSLKPRKLIVQKYGGATLADPEKIKAVAARLAAHSKEGTQIVAVVSAMGKTTNQLIELANKISNRPNRREMDMLLTTGERISMALVSMALHDLGCAAISFTGSQAGILTDHSHVNAFIRDVKAFRVQDALKDGKVVVLAGFQGVSPETKEITTLGRGGSDTTAVAMAAFLKAEVCEILKDVPAVFSADPHLVMSAKALRELSYEHLLEMTFWGAKVLHYRSVELAQRKKIPLYIGPASFQTNEGTWVREGQNMFESAKILSINSHERVLEITASKQSGAVAIESMRKFLDDKEIAFPQILQIIDDSKFVRFFLTGPTEILHAIEKEISQSIFKLSSQKFASVTATCTGSTAPDVVQKILKALDQMNISVHTTLQSPLSTTVIIAQSDRDQTVQVLHSLI
jgi:aspartate kinase